MRPPCRDTTSVQTLSNRSSSERSSSASTCRDMAVNPTRSANPTAVVATRLSSSVSASAIEDSIRPAVTVRCRRQV